MPENQPSPNSVSARKAGVRDQLVATRNRISPADIDESARHLAEVLLVAPHVRRATTVAAYVSIGREPGTSVLRRALADAGKRVILPVLLPDGDLDWGLDTGDTGLVAAAHGLLQPVGPSLGVDAVAAADAVLVPALAVSATGLRLGRGGGSYDRALSRVPDSAFTCALLYDAELDVDVPGEPHDRRVTAAATPTRIVRF